MTDFECSDCGFYDCDYGCTCPSLDLWYACPLEPPATPENFEFDSTESGV